MTLIYSTPVNLWRDFPSVQEIIIKVQKCMRKKQMRSLLSALSHNPMGRLERDQAQDQRNTANFQTPNNKPNKYFLIKNSIVLWVHFIVVQGTRSRRSWTKVLVICIWTCSLTQYYYVFGGSTVVLTKPNRWRITVKKSFSTLEEV